MGELLIKNILCFDFGYKNVEIEKDLNGKPIIKGSCNHFFNISHSGNWIICVVDTECIGIDIEKIEVIDVKKFGSIYTTNEYNRILSSNTPIELFYRLWTIKESFTKLIGRGLQIPLNDFEVYDTIEYDNEQYFYKEYSDFEGYALTICSQKNVFSSEIEIRSINNGRKEKEQNEL